MAETETLEIKYLIEAQDKATATLDKINKSMGNLQTSMDEVDKAQKRVGKSSVGLGTQFKNIATSIDATVNTLKNFWDLLQGLDFKKIKRTLLILGFLLRLRGFSGLSDMILKAAKNVDVLEFQFDKLNSTIKKVQDEYGTFTGMLLEITGINALIGGLKSIVIEAGIVGAAFVALSATDKGLDIIVTSLLNIRYAVTSVGVAVSDFIGVRFPRAGNLAAKGFIVLDKATKGLTKTIYKASVGVSNFRKGTASIGGAFAKAATHTEILERGIFGLATRATLAAGGFSALGRVMLRSDSIMGKMAGITLIGLAVAFGGLALVIRQILLTVGQLIFDLGTKLVGAMQSSVQKMTKLKDATFTFGFVLKGLNRETDGAVGSLQEWNKVMGEFSTKTGYSLTIIQKSVSELTRFGESIGLTKEQMKELLPIIGDVAEANHKDLFTSTLAVVEALAGQTVMLGNMGISLNAHSKAVHDAAKAEGVHYSKLQDAGKAQVRYSALIKESAKIRGVAEASVNTMTGAIRRNETAHENLSLSIGEGAEIIERQYVSQVAWLTQMLQELTAPMLKVIGFLAALSGRFLQGAGIIIKFSFAIVLLTSSIGALNIVLKNVYISRFILQMTSSIFVTQKLALVMPQLAKTIQLVGAQVAATGLSLKTFAVASRVAFIAAAKAAWALVAPLALIAIKIGIVVGILYTVYKALQLIEEKTGIFSEMFDPIQKWWAASSVFEEMKELIVGVGQVIIEYFVKSVITTAQAIVYVVNGFLALKGIAIIVMSSMRDGWNSIKEASLDAWNAIIGGLVKIGDYVLTLVGGNDALAGSLETLKDKSVEVKKSVKGLTEAEKENLTGVVAQRLANEALIKTLGDVSQAMDSVSMKKDMSDPATDHEQALTLLEVFHTSRKEMEMMDAGERLAAKKLMNDRNFILIKRAFGQEAAYKLARETKIQLDEIKNLKTSEERQKKYQEIITGIAEKGRQGRKKINDKEIADQKRTDQAKITATQNFLQAGIMLAKENSKEQRALQIAAAVVNTYASGVRAMRDYPYPANLWVLGSTIAVGLATVAKMSKGGYFTGGVVGESGVGDKQTIQVNGGEAVYNKSQQRELYSMVQGNNNGGNSGVTEAINNLAAAIAGQDNVVQVDGREIARVVRNEVSGGFQLA